MNLKRRLSKEVSIVGIIFGLVLLVLTGFYFHMSESFDDILTQSEPTLDALDHMLVDVYENHVLLISYLQTTSYAESLLILQEIKQADVSSAALEQRMELLIAQNHIADKHLIENYRNALVLHEQVTAFRDELLVLHENELTSLTYASSEKREVLSQYLDLLSESTTEFQRQSDYLTAQSQLAKQSLLIQSRVYVVITLLILLFCVLTIVYKVRQFSKQIIEPVDETIEATKQFVDGNYDLKIEPKTNISEIESLQENINAVFNAISTIAKSDVTQKKSIQKQLLKKEYVAILEYLKQQSSEKMKVTMLDIKKEFSITHPTALTRIKYLEENGYIYSVKEGRDKCLFLKSEN